MSVNDPYEMLGVSRTATQDEIKNAYRALAKKYHPDLNPGNPSAESRFKEISRAFDQVGTPEARAKFDRGEEDESAGADRGAYYHRTQQGFGGGTGRYTSAFDAGLDEDFFESIFGAFGGGGRRRRSEARASRGTDQLYTLEIDAGEAVRGGTREMTLPNGKRLSVKIPAGISEGTRLRFAGQGDAGDLGGSPGDAYVEIRLRADPRFKKEGSDLLYELPITIDEAVLGTEARIPTLDGDVMLRIPPRSSSGVRLRLAGKGTPRKKSGGRGDQLVVLKVVVPDTVDEELIQALLKWKNRRAAA